jgi:hypothetical protein
VKLGSGIHLLDLKKGQFWSPVMLAEMGKVWIGFYLLPCKVFVKIQYVIGLKGPDPFMNESFTLFYVLFTILSF